MGSHSSYTKKAKSHAISFGPKNGRKNRKKAKEVKTEDQKTFESLPLFEKISVVLKSVEQ